MKYADEQIRKIAEKEYGIDLFKFAAQREGFINGFKQALNIACVNGSACDTHKIKQLPYLQWHEWAESLHKKGIKQVQCNKCKRWLFPEEI